MRIDTSDVVDCRHNVIISSTYGSDIYSRAPPVHRLSFTFTYFKTVLTLSNMNRFRVPPLVSVKWLNNLLANVEIMSTSRFKILQSTRNVPASNSNSAEDYPGQRQHIVGSSFFNIDECLDKTSKYKRMLPSEKEFAQYVGNLGVSSKTHVIVYDNSKNFGFGFAPRVWWMFRTFGHKRVSVLNGGLLKWVNEGFGVTPSHETPNVIKPTLFKPVLHPSAVKTFKDMDNNIIDQRFQVMDARSPDDFNGVIPDKTNNEDAKLGHIPGSTNVHYTELLNQERGEMRSEFELINIFQKKGIDLNKPLVATCLTGVTACSLVLAAHVCGKRDVAVFDGAWKEYSDKAKPENIHVKIQ